MPRLIVHAATWNVFTEILSNNTSISTLMHATTARMNLEARFCLLHDVVEAAFTDVQAPDDDSEYIRLFLAPEYYFSYTPHSHLISHNASQRLEERLRLLSAQAFARNTLIVPGTIAYYKAFKQRRFLGLFTTRKQRDKREKYAEVLQDANEMGIREKRLYLAHNTAYVFFNGRKLFSYRKVSDAAEVGRNENIPAENRRGRTLFAPGTGDGIFRAPTNIPLTIGIEICADHAHHVLEQLGQPVDLLLVPHASVQVRPDESAVKPGGYLLEAFGGLRDAYGMAQSYAWQKQDDGLARIAVNQALKSSRARALLHRDSESRQMLKDDLKAIRNTIRDDLQYADNTKARLVKTHKHVHGGLLQVFELEFESE
jgi:predicted amidohydrolase